MPNSGRLDTASVLMMIEDGCAQRVIPEERVRWIELAQARPKGARRLRVRIGFRLTAGRAQPLRPALERQRGTGLHDGVLRSPLQTFLCRAQCLAPKQFRGAGFLMIRLRRGPPQRLD